MMICEQTPSLQSPHVTIADRLTVATLLGVVVVYAGAALCNRYQPVDASIFFLLLLPLGWIFGVCNRSFTDLASTRWVIASLGLILWLATAQTFSPAAIPGGWWRFAERGCAFSACLFLIIRQADTGILIRYLGSAAAIAAFFVLIMNGYHGLLKPQLVTCYGFGHINIFTNTVGPSLLAWCVYVVYSWRHGKRFPISECALLTIGVLSLIILAIVTQRRGVMIAWAAAGLWGAAWWAWQYSRRVTLSFILITVSLGVFFMALRLQGPVWCGGRDERIALYSSAIDGILSSTLWGYGGFGALRLHDCDSEAARHVIATGTWQYHCHNEFLDIALDGGIIALCGAIVLALLLSRHLLRLSDPAHRTSLQALGVAVLVHLCTDNCYGTTVGLVWLGIVTGIMWTAPNNDSRRISWRFMPRPWMLMTPCILASGWGAVTSFYPAILSSQASNAGHTHVLQHAYEPQAINRSFNQLVEAQPPLDNSTQQTLIQESIAKLGRHGRLDFLYLTAFGETCSSTELISNLNVLLHHYPFHQEAYDALAQNLRLYPQESHLVEPRILHRLPWLSGIPSARPTINIVQRPRSIDEAADLYAAIIWATKNKVPWSDMQTPLVNLFRWYGDVAHVSKLAFSILCMAPPNSLPELYAMDEQFRMGLRFSTIIEVLQTMSDPNHARSIVALLWHWNQALRLDCETGTMPDLSYYDEENLQLRLAIIRTWGLSLRK